MAEEQSSSKPIKRKQNGLWPDVSSIEGATKAARLGAGAMIWVLLSYLLLTALAFLLPDTAAVLIGDADADEDTAVGLALIAAIAVPVAALLAWLLWSRKNLIAAWIALVWAGVEAVMSLANGVAHLAVGALVLTLAVNGVRGAHAYRKLRGAATG
ncbi:MAG TPA: hypothetical protein VEU47_14880 [Candidatus Cybelea sp.]|nr:hypothetical protein [Candidatus Cybelea sp.]